jgi:hypothetical protein
MIPKELFWSGLKGGLFEEKHYRAMGESIWLFGWLCVRQSQINESGEGLPHYGNPLRDEEVSADTGFSIRTIQSWRAKLVRAGYIHTARVGNVGLVYFIHKAKHKAKNPKPSTRYFPAALQPNGSYKVSHDPAGPRLKVSQNLAGTSAEKRDTYASNSLENQGLPQNANTVIPKHLSNYKTDPHAQAACSPTVLFEKLIRRKGLPTPPSPKQLDERRRELLQQGEEMARKYPTFKQTGQVVAIRKEATA